MMSGVRRKGGSLPVDLHMHVCHLLLHNIQFPAVGEAFGCYGCKHYSTVPPCLQNLNLCTCKPYMSALETTMLPKRPQQCSLLIPLSNTSIFIS
jgi:hypothetical protein